MESSKLYGQILLGQKCPQATMVIRKYKQGVNLLSSYCGSAAQI